LTGVDTWEASTERLQARTRGRVLVQGAEGYDESRRVFNAMIDRYPALILRCESAEDVVEGVGFAREHGLPVSAGHLLKSDTGVR
jgi:hypothetical protein